MRPTASRRCATPAQPSHQPQFESDPAQTHVPAHRWRGMRTLLIGALATCALAGPAASAQAQLFEPPGTTPEHPYDPQVEYSVTTTGDAADAAIGDGVCRTASGTCSLRAALQEAAVDRATSKIGFDFDAKLPTIAPRSALPAISDLAGPTIIDASAPPEVPASAWDTRIQLRGPGPSAGFSGLTITSPGNTVRGLAIFNFRHQIRVTGWNNRIEQNYLGTGWEATFAAPAADPTQDTGGVLLEGDAATNTIARNLIAGNADIGVLVRGTASANTITENDIGALPDRHRADCPYPPDKECPAPGTTLANRSHGVVLTRMTRFNVIAGNLIGGNGGVGVRLAGTLNRVSHNAIGARGLPRFGEDEYRSLPNASGNLAVVGTSTEARVTENFMAGSPTSVQIGEDGGDTTTSAITGTRVADNTIGHPELIDPLPQVGIAVWQGSRVEIAQNKIQYHHVGLRIHRLYRIALLQIRNVFEGNGTNIQNAP